MVFEVCVDKDDDEEVPEPVLVGKAKELDETMDGALTDLMMENFKEFKHGAKAGGTTPVVRIVSPGSKVSSEGKYAEYTRVDSHVPATKSANGILFGVLFR